MIKSLEHQEETSPMLSRSTAFLSISVLALVAFSGPPVLAKKRGEDRFISNARQLTYDGRRSGECYFSPDGKRLVFMSERVPDNPFFQIFVLDLETGDIDRVSPGRGKATCPFFQAETGLLEFASTHLDPDFETKAKEEYKRREEGTPRRGAWDYDETYDIFLFKPDGEVVKQLTDAHGYDAEGGFSPDGKKIVFCSLRDAYPVEELTEDERTLLDKQPDYFGEIYIMDADGGNQERLTDWPGYDGGPFFTPDGERIVWRHFTEDGLTADVYTMKLDGSDIRRLTDFKAMSWAPFFHPSGEYVLFVSNKLGFDNFEIFMVDAMGTRQPVQVTYTQKFDGLWTSNHTDSGMSQLFIGSWDHEAAAAALEKAPKRE
jgi:Tol biopolymer transport system component